jgi:ABC-type Fe3+ transport system permease subunit
MTLPTSSATSNAPLLSIAQSAVVVGIATAVFAVCCVVPVAHLVMTALVQGEHGAALLDARQRGLLYNTGVLGVSTSLLATGVGVLLGAALARVPLPRRPSFACHSRHRCSCRPT